MKSVLGLALLCLISMGNVSFAANMDSSSEQPVVLLRIVSATWCGPCHRLKAEMVKAGALKVLDEEDYTTGDFTLDINGKEVLVLLDRIEDDIISDEKKSKLSPAYTKEGIKGFPSSQIYIDGELYAQGHAGELSKQFGIPSRNAKGSLSTFTVFKEAVKKSIVGL